MQCKVFAALTAGETDRIAALVVDKTYEAGAVMFHENERADELFVLEEGKVALQMSCAIPPRRRVTVDLAFKGDLVGWAPLVEPHIHNLTAICLQTSRVLAVDANRFRALLREDNPMCSKLMKGLAQDALSRLNDTRHLLVSERLWPPKIEWCGQSTPGPPQRYR
jgi:CRP-like cAMP-binding protein